MRQRSLLFSIALGTGLAASAQITLNEADNAPVPGGLFPISASTADSITPVSGANVTFGCWMLLEASNRDISHLDVAVTTTSTLIPAAEVISTDGGNDSLFWSSDATGLFLEGERNLATFAYSDPIKELAYPCTYGTTWTDNGAASFTIPPYNVVRAVSVSGNADGYGTLELPSGPISDVLRVSVRKESNDQSIFSLQRITNTTYFFEANVHYPILKLVTDSASIAGGAWAVTFTNEWMYGQGIIGLEEAEEAVFTCYPNPVAELLVLPVPVKGAARCDVHDAAGRVVLSAQLNAANGAHQLPVSGLPIGLYTARITDADGLRTTRFQVAR